MKKLMALSVDKITLNRCGYFELDIIILTVVLIFFLFLANLNVYGIRTTKTAVEMNV